MTEKYFCCTYFLCKKANKQKQLSRCYKEQLVEVGWAILGLGPQNSSNSHPWSEFQRPGMPEGSSGFLLFLPPPNDHPFSEDVLEGQPKLQAIFWWIALKLDSHVEGCIYCNLHCDATNLWT